MPMEILMAQHPELLNAVELVATQKMFTTTTIALEFQIQSPFQPMHAHQ